MEIKTDNWFPSTIWSVDFLDVDNQKIIDFAYNLQTEDPQGATNTNYVGWQSKFLDSRTADPEVFKLVNFLNGVVETIRLDCGLPPLNLYNIWININKQGSYNSVHNHRGSLISGCYYVRVPKNSGNIEFFRSDDAEYYIPSNLSTYNYFNSTKIIYESKDHRTLLFPSWLKHAVQGNQSKDERISIAFNYGLR